MIAQQKYGKTMFLQWSVFFLTGKIYVRRIKLTKLINMLLSDTSCLFMIG